jgi:hypothetical protein
VTERYEIQGRIVERHAGVILRDEARRASRDSLAAAREVAATFLADGLVTWIFEVRWEPGRTTPSYTMVDRAWPITAKPPSRNPAIRVTARPMTEGRAA